MKVDLGTCTLCGAKNSKFVETCYKCGAALPWAPGYVAPKASQPKSTGTTPTPQSAPSRPASPQATSPSKSEVKTVLSPPKDYDEPTGPDKKALTDTITERITNRVAIPAWAVGLGGLGCVALGMGLFALTGGRNDSVTPTVPVSTPVPTQAVSASPVLSGSPAPTAAQTVAAAVPPTVVITVAPTATVAPTVAPVAAVAPTPVVATQIRIGPSFDEVDVKMDDRTSAFTEAQKQSYWQSVAGSVITWTGAVVEVRLTSGGQVALRCGKQTNSYDVMASLDGSQMSSLGQINKGENLTIEGILADHTSSGYTISRAKIVKRG